MTQQRQSPRPTIVPVFSRRSDGGTAGTGSTRGSSTQTRSHPHQAAWVSNCHPEKAGGGKGRAVRLAPWLSVPASGLRGHSTQEVEGRLELSLGQARLLWVHPAPVYPGTMGSPSS